jgi:peptidoglycan/xylan/chitin deacetylase (PgdA/CDA1 family)
MVLYYHSVPEAERAQFANQLDAILRHAQPLSLAEPAALAPNKHHIAITFDDAFENFADVALPELQKRQLTATVFVITDALGKAFGPAERSEKVMSLEQLRALPQETVAIGSHTLTHPMLTRVSAEEARREIVDSRTKLEKLMDRKVSMFSFPFGDFSERLIPYCREAGYSQIFTTLPAFALRTPGEFVVGRVRVDPADWPLEFRLKLAGAYRWMPFAIALKRRLRRIVQTPTSRAGVSKAPATPQSVIRELT